MTTGDAEARELVQALVEIGREHVVAVLLFGSRLVQASPDRFSAHDLVLVVDDYREFHRRLVAAGHHRRGAWVLDIMARVLPPNVIAFVPRPDGPVGKTMVFDEADFRRALSPMARDHFLKGRMAQNVALLYARDPEVEAWVPGVIAASREDTVRWAGPFVEAPFGPEEFARRMLEVSYGGEIRPESGERVAEVFAAQREFLVETYAAVLDALARRGSLVRDSRGRYRLPSPPGRLDRARIRAYFFRSKIRATARWLKHVATFNDWLTYIQRKVERRTGMTVEITRLERRYPLIFLWPKVVRVLRARARSDGEGGS